MKKEKSVLYLRSTGIREDSRATKEIEALREKGYAVHVLGWKREGGTGESTTEGTDRSADWFRMKAGYGNGMRSLLPFCLFQLWIGFKMLTGKNRYGIIHSCDFDTGYISFFVNRFLKKKFIYDIYDYYVHSHNLPEKLASWVEKKEIGIINGADGTIICSEQRLAQIGKAVPRRWIALNNTPEIKKEDFSGGFLPQKKEGTLRVVFVGTLNEGRLLKEAAEALEGEPNIELHVAGYGSLAAFFGEKAEKNGNLFFYGQIPYKEALALENECDILFAVYDPEIPNHKYSAPNKLYEAMGLGKPIIVCGGTGIDLLVEKEKLGIVIPYGGKAFRDAVMRLAADSGLREACGKNGERLYREEYRWEAEKQKLENFYKEAAEGKEALRSL